MYEIGLVRVITISDEQELNLHGKLIEEYFPKIKVESKCINQQPEGIYNDITEEKAIPKIISLINKNFLNKTAIVISCAGDPGMSILRNRFDIPIIFAGESTCVVAKVFGEKFGVLGLTKNHPTSYVNILGKENIVGKGDIPGVNNTIDLKTLEGKNKIIKQANHLKSLGAKVIVFACTGLSTIGIQQKIKNEVNIPVIDCVKAEASMAYAVCSQIKLLTNI